MRPVSGFSAWIGTARDARDIKRVLDAGIEAMIDLGLEEPPVATTRELIYLRFPLRDGSGNPHWLLELAVSSVARLLGERVPTLVACGAGMSRSPAVVALAVATMRNQEPELALQDIAAGGPIDVSPGLWNELKATLSSAS